MAQLLGWLGLQTCIVVMDELFSVFNTNFDC